jgi:hypothetical protein
MRQSKKSAMDKSSYKYEVMTFYPPSSLLGALLPKGFPPRGLLLPLPLYDQGGIFFLVDEGESG